MTFVLSQDGSSLLPAHHPACRRHGHSAQVPRHRQRPVLGQVSNRALNITVKLCNIRCEEEISHLPKPLERSFCKQNKETQVKEDSIRVLSWNILSQGKKRNNKSKAIQVFTFSALGTQNDGFVKCPPEALEWETRRWRLLEELVRHQPDIICLQEVREGFK